MYFTILFASIIFQFHLGDPEMLSGQLTCIIPPVSSGSILGSPNQLDMLRKPLKEGAQEASWLDAWTISAGTLPSFMWMSELLTLSQMLSCHPTEKIHFSCLYPRCYLWLTTAGDGHSMVPLINRKCYFLLFEKKKKSPETLELHLHQLGQ